MGTIKIIIDEEGQIKVEAKEGFEGKSCQEAIDFIMNNLKRTSGAFHFFVSRS